MAHLLTRLSGKERLDTRDASELLEFLQVQAESALSRHTVRPTSNLGTGAFTKPGYLLESFSYSDGCVKCREKTGTMLYMKLHKLYP